MDRWKKKKDVKKNKNQIVNDGVLEKKLDFKYLYFCLKSLEFYRVVW